MFAAVARWPKQRWPWVLLAVSALSLMLVALFFQYGMALAPCIMCVYQRFAISGIFFAGVVGLFVHHDDVGVHHRGHGLFARARCAARQV